MILQSKGGYRHHARIDCASCDGAGWFLEDGAPSKRGTIRCAGCQGQGWLEAGCGGPADVEPFAYCWQCDVAVPSRELTRFS